MPLSYRTYIGGFMLQVSLRLCIMLAMRCILTDCRLLKLMSPEGIFSCHAAAPSRHSCHRMFSLSMLKAPVVIPSSVADQFRTLALSAGDWLCLMMPASN